MIMAHLLRSGPGFKEMRCSNRHHPTLSTNERLGDSAAISLITMLWMTEKHILYVLKCTREPQLLGFAPLWDQSGLVLGGLQEKHQPRVSLILPSISISVPPTHEPTRFQMHIYETKALSSVIRLWIEFAYVPALRSHLASGANHIAGSLLHTPLTLGCGSY